MTDDRSFWGHAFDTFSRKKGDTAEANKYVSVRNFALVRNAVLSLLGDTRRAVVLDVGCGTGHLSQRLVRDNVVVGADLSSEMLRFAAAKGLIPIHGRAEELPFQNSVFDVVLANSVIQLIPDGRAFVVELFRVVRPGGRVIIATINAESAAVAALRWVERSNYRHFRLYPLAELSALVAGAGGVMRGTTFLYYPLGRAALVRGDKRPGLVRRRFASTVIVDAVRPG
jgi:2-polyprenyl-3-methyl-5-hydroxy-6-metoxy-1,4-benzoquinol methylase